MNIQKLTREEFAAWDDAAAISPQAGLFHTTYWNQMLCETADNNQTCKYIVCEKKGKILGGIALHSRGGKSNLPIFGYNGPFFHPEINYRENQKTVPGYEVHTELLHEISSLTRQVHIRNQPEIWNTRAYSFNKWQVRTNYTHILDCSNKEDLWKKTSSPLSEKAREQQFIVADTTNDPTQKSLPYIINLPAFGWKSSKSKFTKRVQWLKEQGLCRIIQLIQKNGEKLASAFFILSKENKTIYLHKSILPSNAAESEIFSLLIWHSYLSFGAGFEQIDLGTSNTMSMSRTKDSIGGKLTPFFVTTSKKYFFQS